MAKLTLARRDAYLAHTRPNVKPNEHTALRTALCPTTPMRGLGNLVITAVRPAAGLENYGIISWLWKERQGQVYQVFISTSQGSVELLYSSKWCHTHQLDDRAPSIKPITKFLLYLFKSRNLQPSAIHGYRSAIADKLGNSPINVSTDCFPLNIRFW